MADTRDPKAGNWSDFAPVAAHPEGTRLAHWPPPHRINETKLKTLKHPGVDAPKRAHARGWRMTRAMFSEFDEEE